MGKMGEMSLNFFIPQQNEYQMKGREKLISNIHVS